MTPSTFTVRTKQSRYMHLVQARKACRLCKGCLVNASQIAGGRYDLDEIGPYSTWQGNLDSNILVVAQDFSDVAGFDKYEGRPGDDVMTNRNLRSLFGKSVGVKIAAPMRHTSDDILFFTNAVLCMKSGAEGGRQQAIPRHCFENCSVFLRETIEIVAPSLVVTLGARALDSVRFAFSANGNRPLCEVVGQVELLTQGISLIPMYHPSLTVINTKRNFDIMTTDWCHIRGFIKSEMRQNVF
ncbi:MAG: uracil-DNA glycosylase family protein [bacterium]